MATQTRLHEGIFIALDGRHLPFERILTPILVKLLKHVIPWRDDARMRSTQASRVRAAQHDATYDHLCRVLISRGVELALMKPKQCCLCTRVAARVVRRGKYWQGYCVAHTANAFLERRREIKTEIEPRSAARHIAIHEAKVRADNRALQDQSLRALRRHHGSR